MDSTVSSHSAPIVGGNTVTIDGNFSFQVALVTLTGLLHCSGFILSEKFAGTAAHCIQGKEPQHFRLGFGSVDMKSMQFTNISTFYVHKKFDTKSGDFDVGLIKIEDSFRGANIKPISISQGNLIPGSPITVSGWGATKGTGGNRYILRAAELQIVPQKVCFGIYKSRGEIITENMICAIALHKTPCHGDSGGPLTSNGTLVGIVSWGDQNCRSNPAVFTDVTSTEVQNFFNEYI